MITEKFDFLLQPQLRAEFEREGIRLEFKAGDILVEPHKYIKIVPLVLHKTFASSDRMKTVRNYLFITSRKDSPVLFRYRQ